MTPLLPFALIFAGAFAIVIYQIGKRHGFVEAEQAWREQRAPLPSLQEREK